jgi:hypothetical protein
VGVGVGGVEIVPEIVGRSSFTRAIIMIDVAINMIRAGFLFVLSNKEKSANRNPNKRLPMLAQIIGIFSTGKMSDTIAATSRTTVTMINA